MNGRRKAREKVMNVDQVRLEAANVLAHFSSVLERIDRLKPRLKRIDSAHNRIVILFPKFDFVAHPRKQTGFRLHDAVFSARLLVSVVNEQNPHQMPNST